MYRLPEPNARPNDPWVYPTTNLGATRDLRDYRITSKWVPGHAGVGGNEEADASARGATTQGTLVPDVIKTVLGVCVSRPSGNRTRTTPREASRQMRNRLYAHGGVLPPSGVTLLWWLARGLSTPVSCNYPLCASSDVQPRVRLIFLVCRKCSIRCQRICTPSIFNDMVGDNPDILTRILDLLLAIDLLIFVSVL